MSEATAAPPATAPANAPAAPPPTTPPAPPPEPKKVSDKAPGFFKSFRGEDATTLPPPKPPETPPPAPEPKKKPDVAAPETPPPAPPEGPKPPEPPKKGPKRAKGYENVPAPLQPLIDDATAEKLANATARATAAALESQGKRQEPEPFNISEAEREDIAVLERMETLFPTLYKGHAERAKKFLHDLPSFTERWEAAHPHFDPKKAENEFESEDGRAAALDAAVDELRGRYGLEWEETHYRKAERDLDVAPLRQELEEARKRLKDLSEAEQARNIAVVAAKNADEASLAVAKAFGEAGVFDEKGELKADKWQSWAQSVLDKDGQIDKTKLEAFTKDDQISGPILKDAMERAKAFANIATAAFRGQAVDGAEHVVNYCLSLEDALSKMQSSETTRNGKQFMPRLDYLKLDHQQQKRFWTIDADQAIMGYATEIATKAKEFSESEQRRIDEIIAKRGLKPEAKNGHPPAAPAPAAPIAKPVTVAAPSPGLRNDTPAPKPRAGSFFNSWKSA